MSVGLLPKQPIPGYEIRERIGAGGYGEVWKADAPGGLVKAIKFIYGQMDEVRATGELKSLQRIKQVRHPFLLSLERIEVIDGQLVIVTELADGCLKDRYTECRTAEMPGIPRDELLVYMGDAADALDYMNANFSLQHLDVKPENLLLVGGRVKVGDFGLVKDIHDYTVSMMGGLTPIYAPPEVFDGKPSHFSDQYSLAIVYQEMLTGMLPFPGKTASQLAAQHLHGQPRLSCLPETDQGTIHRALSKTPTERFPTCRAMIDQLLEAGRARRLSKSSPSGVATSHPDKQATGSEQLQTAPLAAPQGGDAATEQLGPAAAGPHIDTSTQIQPLVLRSRAEAVVAELPPVTCGAEEMRLRPTLLVGIGGLAAVTLRGVRRCLHERFGRLDAVPAIGMLLLDTDRTALYQATQGDPAWAFQPRETLALPLRRTQDYRRDSEKFLKWLSRRWLYNIPRSLETEGLRPLGRLALVDHLDDVRRRLTEATKHITEPAAIEATSEATGIDFAGGAPRVVLVASICGGTGSGMVLDAAYVIRALQRELGFATADVSGVLLYATPMSAQARELATVNAYACLNELHHFSQRAHGYPGDPACRLAATGLPPLDQTYVVHLGDDLDDERLAQGASSVAAYVYRDLATPAGPLLAKCRAAGKPAAEQAEIQVRTLGVCQVGGAGSALADTAVELLGRAVVQRWSGEASGQTGLLVKEPSAGASRSRHSDAREASEVPRLSLECADTLELELPRLRGRMDQLLEAALGKPPAAHLGALVQQFAAQQAALHGEDGPLAVDDFVETLDRLLGPRCDEAQLPAPTAPLEKALVKQIEALADSRAATLVDWLYRTAALPQAGVQGALKAAEWFVQHLRALEKEAREASQSLRQEILSCEQVLRGAPADSRASLLGLGRGKKAAPERDELLQQMALRRAADLSLRCLIRLVRGMVQRAGVALDALRDLRRALGDLVRGFSPGPPLEDDEAGGGLGGVHLAVGRALQSRLDELTDRLVESFSRQVLGERGLRSLIEQPELIAQLPAQLRQAGRQSVRAAIGECDLAGWLMEDGENRLKEALAKAQPRLLTECGGARRYLICQPEGAPDGADVQRLPDALCEEFHVQPMLAGGQDPDLVICCEAENVSLARAAANLTEESLELPQMAARVRTRIDVAWTPLPQ